MLFHSLEFITVFMPIVVLGYMLLRKFLMPRASLFWLLLASLFFYGWWEPRYLILLMGSVAFNYVVGQAISNYKNTPLFVFSITANLMLLAYYKYVNFFIYTFNDLTGAGFDGINIVLPLAISFFTFQQIAYLVDSRRNLVKHEGFGNYALFVVFFPQLIAGPIVHHSQTMSQFARRMGRDLRAVDLSIGMTIFIIGLFKKAVLADNVGVYSDAVFNGAARGVELAFFEAWAGALAFSFQIYFDFSGYSDMAVGLARLFGIRLPINFNSPYKSANIIDFWRRWHITLSRFLRDYLYIPLGGNRHGTGRRYMNIAITMLLGGLWHGAAWTFVIWGGVHGALIAVNHGVHRILGGGAISTALHSTTGTFVRCGFTFAIITICWVFFRAQDIQTAWHILQSMAGLNSGFLPHEYVRFFGPLAQTLQESQVFFETTRPYLFGGREQLLWLFACFVVVWGLPNAYEWLARYRVVSGFKRYRDNLPWQLQWRPTLLWGVSFCIAFLSVAWFMASAQEFLYFQF